MTRPTPIAGQVDEGRYIDPTRIDRSSVCDHV